MFTHGIEALLFIREHRTHSQIKCMTQAISDYIQTGYMSGAYDPNDFIVVLSDVRNILERLPEEHRKILALYIDNGLEGEGGALAYIHKSMPELATVDMRVSYFMSLVADYELLLEENDYLVHSGSDAEDFDKEFEVIKSPVTQEAA